MLIYEVLYEYILDSKHELIEKMNDILNHAISEYLKKITFIGKKDDGTVYKIFDDDPELLEIILTKYSKNSPFSWSIAPEENKNPVDLYVHSASVYNNGNIHFNLDPITIENNWGPKTFKKIIMKILAHEVIHLIQQDRMGKEKYKTIPSGFMKGLKVAAKNKSNDFNIVAKYYLSDPQEIMAHAHDLALEIADLKNPDMVIRNPQKYINQLPTYHKYRTYGFNFNDNVIKKLLKYTSDYLQKKGIIDEIS